MKKPNILMNTKHLRKVTAAWVTIVYIVCFGGVALIPAVRPWFMHYALHMNSAWAKATFISGLVIWNVIGFFGRVAFHISTQPNQAIAIATREIKRWI